MRELWSLMDPMSGFDEVLKRRCRRSELVSDPCPLFPLHLIACFTRCSSLGSWAFLRGMSAGWKWVHISTFIMLTWLMWLEIGWRSPGVAFGQNAETVWTGWWRHPPGHMPPGWGLTRHGCPLEEDKQSGHVTIPSNLLFSVKCHPK